MPCSRWSTAARPTAGPVRPELAECGRQDRHQQRAARQLVRRLHRRPPGRGLGRSRRQQADRPVGPQRRAEGMDRPVRTPAHPPLRRMAGQRPQYAWINPRPGTARSRQCQGAQQMPFIAGTRTEQEDGCFWQRLRGIFRRLRPAPLQCFTTPMNNRTPIRLRGRRPAAGGLRDPAPPAPKTLRPDHGHGRRDPCRRTARGARRCRSSRCATPRMQALVDQASAGTANGHYAQAATTLDQALARSPARPTCCRSGPNWPSACITTRSPSSWRCASWNAARGGQPVRAQLADGDGGALRGPGRGRHRDGAQAARCPPTGKFTHFSGSV